MGFGSRRPVGSTHLGCAERDGRLRSRDELCLFGHFSGMPQGRNNPAPVRLCTCTVAQDGTPVFVEPSAASRIWDVTQATGRLCRDIRGEGPYFRAGQSLPERHEMVTLMPAYAWFLSTTGGCTQFRRSPGIECSARLWAPTCACCLPLRSRGTRAVLPCSTEAGARLALTLKGCLGAARAWSLVSLPICWVQLCLRRTLGLLINVYPGRRCFVKGLFLFCAPMPPSKGWLQAGCEGVFWKQGHPFVGASVPGVTLDASLSWDCGYLSLGAQAIAPGVCVA